MQDRERQELLEKLAAARGIPFRPELLPRRSNRQLSRVALSALYWSGRGPVLIVRGERSRIISDEDARQFAATFRRGTAVIIPDAGHNVQEGNPLALAEALRSHIRSAADQLRR